VIITLLITVKGKMKRIMNTENYSAHTFHVPILGIGFTIDTPLKVGRYGISSVISLVDDDFIEQMRKHYCETDGLPYEEISQKDDDARARRITAYLNLLGLLLDRQVKTLQSSPFEEGTEITRYYEFLPDSPLKNKYLEMLDTKDPVAKEKIQSELRHQAVPGSIDANIMTKLDRNIYKKGQLMPPEYANAMSALRGFALSDIPSSIVFSAGLNPRLYSYAASFDGFFPDGAGELKKKIVLKVSDYRSAVVQGKFLAKRGLWISEFRVESGLNCGGHAFATKGHLIGPILEEFKQNREQLTQELFDLYLKGLKNRGRAVIDKPHCTKLTVQGGIGTYDEDRFLHSYYNVDRTGWGTPFLLVPEVTNVDDAHLEKLAAAGEEDVYLSDSSPMAIQFWNLRSSASEEARRARIEEGKPGSPCRSSHGRTGFLFNDEFSETPICLASRLYVKQKLEELQEEDLTEEQLARVEAEVLAKSCICSDLSGGAKIKKGIDTNVTPAMCCGPGIINFSRIATLEEMVSHIYGRLSLLARSDRPHMFIKELSLNVDHLRNEIEKFKLNLTNNPPKYFREFKENLIEGIEYYRTLAKQFVEEKQKRFLDDLRAHRESIEHLFAVLTLELHGEVGTGSG